MNSFPSYSMIQGQMRRPYMGQTWNQPSNRGQAWARMGNPYASWQSDARGWMGGPTQKPMQQDASPVFPVTTSINPSPVYTPEQTQIAMNQARASADRGTLDYFLKRQDQAGVSRSAGSVARAMPAYAANRMQGIQDAEGIGLQHAMANAQSILQGQQGRFQEAVGYAGLRDQIESMLRNQQLNQGNLFLRNLALIR